MDVTTALIMIKGEKKNFSWDNAKKMMAKVDSFKEKLESYDGENIDEDTVGACSPSWMTGVQFHDYEEQSSAPLIFATGLSIR